MPLSTIRKYRDRTRLPYVSEGPSRTKQSFQDECNVNLILSRWRKAGIVTHLSSGTPDYGDFSGAEDYHSSINRVMAAQEAFDALPSAVRARMDNDPGKLLSFVDNPDNQAEAIELGIIADPNPPPKPAILVAVEGGFPPGATPPEETPPG